MGGFDLAEGSARLCRSVTRRPSRRRREGLRPRGTAALGDWCSGAPGACLDLSEVMGTIGVGRGGGSGVEKFVSALLVCSSLDSV